MIALKYDEDDKYCKIQTPSVQDIKNLIDGLNNNDRTYFTIESLTSLISVAGGNQNRVMLIYSDREIPSHQYGRLLDSDYIGVDAEVLIATGGEKNPEKLEGTISKEYAFKAIQDFLENGAFSKEFQWQGRMDKTQY